jgi:protein SCO1
MKKLFLFSLACLFVLTGCKPEAPAPKADASAMQAYDGRGIVRQIAPDRREATIQHGAITNFMGAMTMDFTVKNTNELQNIAPGDEITFKLLVTEKNSWIESVRFVSHVVEEVTNHVFVFHAPSAELKPGDPLPDFTFTAEDGRAVHFSDFRGHVLAFTFFFTRCPLPDFCPRMDLNFAATRTLLRAAPDAPTNWQFLSISFDPDFDLPDKISNYATYYRQADADRWLFSVADTNTLAGLSPLLDLMIGHEDNSISHNLRTVVLDPQGRIARQFDGNQWTPQELADAIRDAAKISAR